MVLKCGGCQSVWRQRSPSTRSWLRECSYQRTMVSESVAGGGRVEVFGSDDLSRKWSLMRSRRGLRNALRKMTVPFVIRIVHYLDVVHRSPRFGYPMYHVSLIIFRQMYSTWSIRSFRVSVSFLVANPRLQWIHRCGHNLRRRRRCRWRRRCSGHVR